jgi:RNA polymerase sigma-70 factor, ECF subfamily
VDTDADLLKRVAAGDRQAIGALYGRFSAVLMGVAVRVLHTRTEAEDVLHDLFVSLPGRARLYLPERGTVAAWLVILTRNMSIDRVRRRVGHQKASENLEPTESLPDPEAVAALVSKRDRILRALSALPAAQRETLQAAFFEGLTYPEIAERDGVPLGTIKSRCSRAITALREALEGDGLTLEDLDPRT